MTSVSLVEELGVSRQRIAQILNSLLQSGKVFRIAEPGRQRRWVWLRCDQNVVSAMAGHARSLPDTSVLVMNALKPDAVHWLGHVAGCVGHSVIAVRKHVRELEARGLAISFRLGQKRYVGITRRGLDHPSRCEGSLAPVADMSKAFGKKRIAFMEALAVLGEAKTIDITAAIAGAELLGAGMMSGQQIAVLTKSNFAEQVLSPSGMHPTYRLTAAGRQVAALVARSRTPPDKMLLEQRITSFRARRKASLRSNSARSCLPPLK